MTITADETAFPIRGEFIRNGVTRAAHPKLYNEITNGLYIKSRRIIAGFDGRGGSDFGFIQPSSSSWGQGNDNTQYPFEDTFTHDLITIGDRTGAASKTYLIFHVYGQDAHARILSDEWSNSALRVRLPSTYGWNYAITESVMAAGPLELEFQWKYVSGQSADARIMTMFLEEMIMKTEDLP